MKFFYSPLGGACSFWWAILSLCKNCFNFKRQETGPGKKTLARFILAMVPLARSSFFGNCPTPYPPPPSPPPSKNNGSSVRRFYISRLRKKKGTGIVANMRIV